MAARPVEPAALRSVYVVGREEVFDAKAALYDRERACLRPNLVCVDNDGAIVFETNEVGLKGDPLDPARRLAVVWGDSVVFGSGRGWACLIDERAPSWQFLNGGLAGDPADNILRRARDFNRRHRVALNLLMLGWHHFVPEPPGTSRRPGELRPGNEALEHDLTAFLQAVPNTVMMTMPTAISRGRAERDLSAYLVPGDDRTGFWFIGAIPYQVDGQRQGFEHVVERNAITRAVCARLGVRLIDLFVHFDTENAVDFREHFYDILHLRPASYPRLVEIVHREIADLL